MRALAFEFGLEPTLQHVNELEVDLMVMALAELLGKWRDHADHLRGRKALGRSGDAEGAIGRIWPQPISLEVGLVQVTDGETLLPARFDVVHDELLFIGRFL